MLSFLTYLIRPEKSINVILSCISSHLVGVTSVLSFEDNKFVLFYLFVRQVDTIIKITHPYDIAVCYVSTDVMLIQRKNNLLMIIYSSASEEA